MLVKEYFALLQQALAKSPFTCSQQVSFDARSDYIGVVRGILIFEDESTLHFTECVNTGHQVQKLKYRYQYQSADGITIFRYDNAPHHGSVPTFPHHKHVGVGELPVESPAPGLQEVVDEITGLILTQMSKGENG